MDYTSQDLLAARFMVVTIESYVAQESSKRLIAQFRRNELNPEVADELGYTDPGLLDKDFGMNPGRTDVDDQDLMVYDWGSLQAMAQCASPITQALINDTVRAVRRESNITPYMVATMQVIKDLIAPDKLCTAPYSILHNPARPGGIHAVFMHLFCRRTRMRHLLNAERLYAVFLNLGSQASSGKDSGKLALQKYEYFPEF